MLNLIRNKYISKVIRIMALFLPELPTITQNVEWFSGVRSHEQWTPLGRPGDNSASNFSTYFVTVLHFVTLNW